jgi:uncharacterized membrane protein YtjA (UPF0391 family)
VQLPAVFLWRIVTKLVKRPSQRCFLSHGMLQTALKPVLFSIRKPFPGKLARTLQRPTPIHPFHPEDCVMLYWAAVFFVIALLAAIFGFGGLAASAAGVAKILFFVFLVFALVSFLFGRRSAA